LIQRGLLRLKPMTLPHIRLHPSSGRDPCGSYTLLLQKLYTPPRQFKQLRTCNSGGSLPYGFVTAAILT